MTPHGCLRLVSSIAVLLCSLVLPGAAQGLPSGSAVRSDSLAVYLATIGPGEPVWTRFGHSALIVADRGSGRDIAYNYGMFSFEQENFIGRFLQGRMMYWMRGFGADAHLRAHMAQGRTIWLQELALTVDQRDSLAVFLAWNDQPENRFYRYDYYLDNCATRIRDAIDLVIGGRIRVQTDTASADDPTYRHHTRRAFAEAPLVYTGTLFALGQPVDRRTTPWEEMWLPEAMQRHLRGVTVTGTDGTERPLVASEQVLFEGTYELRARPPGYWTAAALAVGLLLAFIVLRTAQRSRHAGVSRLVAGGTAWVWAAASGTLGIVALALWSLTDHWATAANENLLQLSPLAFPLVVLLPFAFRGSHCARRATRTLTLIIAGGSVLGATLQVLPWFSQVNGPIVAIGLPLNLALAALAMRLAADAGATEPLAPGGGHGGGHSR